MSTKYKINNPEGIYFITFATIEWVDVFTRPFYKNIFVDSLKYCQQHKGLIVYAWCLMSNHVHLIFAARDGNLSAVVRDLKKYSSSKIIKEIENNPLESRKDWILKIFRNAGEKNSNNTNYQFWRQDNQPKQLFPYQNSFMLQKLDYIHQNPLAEAIVQNAEDYLYSSARDYAGVNRLVEIEFLE